MKVIPAGLTRFNFSDNGSVAVECALKMSFQYQYQTGHPKRRWFMCLSEGYHGETIGALSVGSMDLYARIYKPMLMDTIQIKAPDCYRCPYGKCRAAVRRNALLRQKRHLNGTERETCAIIVEPLLQGSAGMRIYPPVYLKNSESSVMSRESC